MQLKSQVFRLLGSAEMLGNPVGLFRNVGRGVKAFFYEPIQGLMRSPEEFAGGLSSGTTALLKVCSRISAVLCALMPFSGLNRVSRTRLQIAQVA
jgi:hypothetical protein